MKIGLSTAAFYGKWEVEEAAAHLRGYGAECAEVFFQTRSEYTREFARLTRDRLDGLPCTSVHPFGTAFENEFFGRSARQRADAMDMLRRVLDAAAELDARLYVYHGRYSPARVELPFDAQRNAEVVARMQEEATQRKIKIAWENVCWCQLATPERAREIRRLLPEIRRAFQKQLDALNEHNYLDVEVEMDVLEGMMKGDGLAGGASAAATQTK